MLFYRELQGLLVFRGLGSGVLAREVDDEVVAGDGELVRRAPLGQQVFKSFVFAEAHGSLLVGNAEDETVHVFGTYVNTNVDLIMSWLEHI